MFRNDVITEHSEGSPLSVGDLHCVQNDNLLTCDHRILIPVVFTMTEEQVVPARKTPYANLKPDFILDAVESVGFRCTGSLLALNSYENRVYQIGLEESTPMVAKFYRPHRWSVATILEEHQFANALFEHEIPVVAPWKNAENVTLHHFKEFHFALFPCWGGHALELDSLEQLEWMGRFLGRMHAVSASRPFQHRATLTVQLLGYDALDFLKTTHFIPDYIKDHFFNDAQEALKKVEDIFQSVSTIQSIRLHGDIHAGNVLWDDVGPHILDFDDCMMGPAIQDLWMLLSGNQEQMSIQMDHILRLIEALRILRQLNYAAWLARRWDDPSFPLNFLWFDTPSYWEELLQNLREKTDV